MVQCPDRIIASIDTGVDDALALAYLLGSTDECELGGVIASYGNVDANTAYANTCAVLDLFGRADIPVFLGSEHPSWADAFIPDAGCAQFHGDDGLGNTRLAGPGLWLMELVCLVMICLVMICLWMCPMRLFLLAGIWRGMFMLIRRWVLVLV